MRQNYTLSQQSQCSVKTVTTQTNLTRKVGIREYEQSRARRSSVFFTYTSAKCDSRPSATCANKTLITMPPTINRHIDERDRQTDTQAKTYTDSAEVCLRGDQALRPRCIVDKKDKAVTRLRVNAVREGDRAVANQIGNNFKLTGKPGRVGVVTAVEVRALQLPSARGNRRQHSRQTNEGTNKRVDVRCAR